jgi:hypothetical protein
VDGYWRIQTVQLPGGPYLEVLGVGCLPQQDRGGIHIIVPPSKEVLARSKGIPENDQLRVRQAERDRTRTNSASKGIGIRPRGSQRPIERGEFIEIRRIGRSNRVRNQRSVHAVFCESPVDLSDVPTGFLDTDHKGILLFDDNGAAQGKDTVVDCTLRLKLVAKTGEIRHEEQRDKSTRSENCFATMQETRTPIRSSCRPPTFLPRKSTRSTKKRSFLFAIFVFFCGCHRLVAFLPQKSAAI